MTKKPCREDYRIGAVAYCSRLYEDAYVKKVGSVTQPSPIFNLREKFPFEVFYFLSVNKVQIKDFMCCSVYLGFACRRGSKVLLMFMFWYNFWQRFSIFWHVGGFFTVFAMLQDTKRKLKETPFIRSFFCELVIHEYIHACKLWLMHKLWWYINCVENWWFMNIFNCVNYDCHFYLC